MPDCSHNPLPCRVGQLSTLQYFPDYLTVAEESAYLHNVMASKAGWKQACPSHASRRPCHALVATVCLKGSAAASQVSGRSLQSYGGQVSDKSGSLLQAPLPRCAAIHYWQAAFTKAATSCGESLHGD